MTQRVLAIHAHPDDELLATGVTLAHFVGRGAEVHVLTCTLGEQGEVIPADLRHHAADRDDTLGPYRREELRAAMAEVGVRSHVLGEDPAGGVLSRYRDSGMAGSPSAADPRAFVQADLDEAAALVAQVITEVRPDLILTYDSRGGYEHPDHIQTHRVTCRAVASLAAPPPLLAVYTPRSWAEEDRAWLHANAATTPPGWTVPHGDYPASVVPDEVVTYEVIDPDAVPLQARGVRHHRTQVVVHPPRYALSNGIAALFTGREGFAEIDPQTSEPIPGGPRRSLSEWR